MTSTLVHDLPDGLYRAIRLHNEELFLCIGVVEQNHGLGKLKGFQTCQWYTTLEFVQLRIFIVEAAIREPISNLNISVAESAIEVFQKEKILITASASAMRVGLFLDLGARKVAVLLGYIRDNSAIF